MIRVEPMKRVFLSFSFRQEDRDLVHDVEQLLASHDLAVLTGRVTGGGQLTEEIMKRIQSCDALVALATRGAASRSEQDADAGRDVEEHEGQRLLLG